MKKLNLLLSLGLAAAFSTSAFALTPIAIHTADEDYEIPLTKAFIPPVGYDDNDTVELVVTGYLPNHCYSLAQTEVAVDKHTQTIHVKQHATKQIEGICAEEENLPAHLAAVQPFTTTARVGRLRANQYTVQYDRNEDGVSVPATRAFNVSPALRPSQDNMEYASVSHAFMSDIVLSGTSVSAVISGSLTSSCVDLSSNVFVSKTDDVIVVLPGLTVREQPLCTFELRPFERTISLGQFVPGTYLLHVRSQNGQAVNTVFTVETQIARRGGNE